MMHRKGVMQYCQYERPPPSGLYHFVQSENAQKPNWQMSQPFNNFRPVVNRKTEAHHQHRSWNKNDSNSCVAMPKVKHCKEEAEEVHSGRNYSLKRRGPKGPTLKANICDWKIPVSKSNEHQNAVYSGERIATSNIEHGDCTSNSSIGHGDSSIGYVGPIGNRTGCAENIDTSSSGHCTTYNTGHGEATSTSSIGCAEAAATGTGHGKSIGTTNYKSPEPKSYKKSPGRPPKKKNKATIESESTFCERTYSEGICCTSPPLPASTVAYCERDPLMKRILDSKPVVRLDRMSQTFIDKQTHRLTSTVINIDGCGMQQQTSMSPIGFSSSSSIDGQLVNRVVSTSLCQTNKNDGNTTLASGHISSRLSAQTSTNEAKIDDILVDPKIMLLSTPLQKACRKGKNASCLTFKVPKNRGMAMSPMHHNKVSPKKQPFNLDKLRSKLTGSHLRGNMKKSYLTSQVGLSQANILADINNIGEVCYQLSSNAKSESNSIESLKSEFKCKLDTLCIPKDIFETDNNLSNGVFFDSGGHTNSKMVKHQKYNDVSFANLSNDDLKMCDTPLCYEEVKPAELLVHGNLVQKSTSLEIPPILPTSSTDEQNVNMSESCLDKDKKDELKVTISRKVLENSITYTLAPSKSDILLTNSHDLSSQIPLNTDQQIDRDVENGLVSSCIVECDNSDNALVFVTTVNSVCCGQKEGDGVADSAGDTTVKSSNTLMQLSSDTDTHLMGSCAGAACSKETDISKTKARRMESNETNDTQNTETQVMSVESNETNGTQNTETQVMSVESNETNGTQNTETQVMSVKNIETQVMCVEGNKTSYTQNTEILVVSVESNETSYTQNIETQVMCLESNEICEMEKIETETKIVISSETSDLQKTETKANRVTSSETSDIKKIETKAKSLESIESSNAQTTETQVNCVENKEICLTEKTEINLMSTKQSKINTVSLSNGVSHPNNTEILKHVERTNIKKTEISFKDVEKNDMEKTEVSAGNEEKKDMEKTEVSAGNEEKNDMEKTEVNAGNEEMKDMEKTEVNAGNEEKKDMEKTEVSAGNEEMKDMEKTEVNAGNEEKKDMEKTEVSAGNEEMKDMEKTEVSAGNEEKKDMEKTEVNAGNEEKNDMEKTVIAGNKKTNDMEKNEISVKNEEKKDMEKTEVSAGNEEKKDMEKTEVSAGNEERIDMEKNEVCVKNEEKKDMEKTELIARNEEQNAMEQTERHEHVMEQIEISVNTEIDDDMEQSEINVGDVVSTGFEETKICLMDMESIDMEKSVCIEDVINTKLSETNDNEQTEMNARFSESSDTSNNKQSETSAHIEQKSVNLQQDVCVTGTTSFDAEEMNIQINDCVCEDINAANRKLFLDNHVPASEAKTSHVITKTDNSAGGDGASSHVSTEDTINSCDVVEGKQAATEEEIIKEIDQTLAASAVTEESYIEHQLEIQKLDQTLSEPDENKQKQSLVDQSVCKLTDTVDRVSNDAVPHGQHLAETELLQTKVSAAESEHDQTIAMAGLADGASDSEAHCVLEINRDKTQEVEDSVDSTVPELLYPDVSLDEDTVKGGCTIEVEPVCLENSSYNDVTDKTVESVKDLVICEAEPGTKPLCIISSVEGAATSMLDEEDDSDECPELLDKCPDMNSKTSSSFNYVFSPTPPPLINVRSMLLPGHSLDDNSVPLLSPATSAAKPNVSVAQEKNKKLLSYKKFILPKPEEPKICQSMNRLVGSSQALMPIAPCIITAVQHLPMSLPIVVGTFPETNSSNSMQLTKLPNDNVSQSHINILKNGQTELYTLSTSSTCNVTKQLPIPVSSNSIPFVDQTPQIVWHCQSQNIGQSGSTMIPVPNEHTENLVQNNLNILAYACSADKVDNQNLTSSSINSVTNKDITLDELTKGRKSPETDDSDATMIYCEDAGVVKRDLEKTGRPTQLARVAQLEYSDEDKLVIDDKQTEETQETLTVMVTGLRRKQKVRKVKKQKNKMVNKEKKKTVLKKDESVECANKTKKRTSRLVEAVVDSNKIQHDVFDFVQNETGQENWQINQGKRVQQEIMNVLENESNVPDVLTVANTKASFQDVFQKTVIDKLSEDKIPKDGSNVDLSGMNTGFKTSMPAEKRKPVRKRKHKKKFHFTRKRRINNQMEIVMDHAEDLDCEKLPTILPPKRLRRHMNNEHAVMRDSMAVPIGNSERIQHDFPRHNWLEEKINKLQESSSPQQSASSSPGIVTDGQKSSSPKQQPQSNRFTTDPKNPVAKRRCKRPLSGKQTKTSGKKMAKLNNDQTVKSSSEQNIQEKIAVNSSDADNLFASSTDSTENALQIDIPAETGVLKSPQSSVLNKDSEGVGQDKDSTVAVECKGGSDDKADGDGGFVVRPVVDEDDSSQNSDRMEVDLDYQEPSDPDVQNVAEISKEDNNNRTMDGHWEMPIDLTTKRPDHFSSSSRQKVAPPVQKVLPQVQQPSEKVDEEPSLTREIKHLIKTKLKVSSSTSGDNSGEMSAGVAVSNTSRISVVSPIKVTEMISLETPDQMGLLNLQSNTGTGSVQVDVTIEEKPATAVAESVDQSVQENCTIQSQTNINSSQEDTPIQRCDVKSSGSYGQSPVPILLSVKSPVPVSSSFSTLPAHSPHLTTQSQRLAMSVSSESQDKTCPINLSGVGTARNVQQNQPSNDSIHCSYNEDVVEVIQVSPKPLVPFSIPVQERQGYVFNKEFQKHLLEYRQLEAMAHKKEQEREQIVRLCKQKAQILKVISSKCQKTQIDGDLPVSSQQKNQQSDITHSHLAQDNEIDLTLHNVQPKTSQSNEQLPVNQLQSTVNSTAQQNHSITDNHSQEVPSFLISKNTTEESLSAEKRRPIVQMINLAMLEARQASKKKHSSGDLISDENKIPAHQSKPQTNHIIDQMYSSPPQLVQSCPYIKRTSPVNEPSARRSVTYNHSLPSPAHSQPPFHIAGSLIIPVEGQLKVDGKGGKKKKDSQEVVTMSASVNRPQQKTRVMKSPEEYSARAGMMGKGKDHMSPTAVFPVPQSYQPSAKNGEINRRTMLLNSEERLSSNSNLAFKMAGAKTMPGGSLVYSLMNSADERNKHNVVDLTKDNDVDSKTVPQKTNIPEPASALGGQPNELVIQRELQEALTMQTMQRVGLAEARKLSQFNKVSEISQRGPFSSLQTSYSTFPTPSHTPAEGHLVNGDVPSIPPALMSLNAKHVSNTSKSKSQGTCIQKHIDSNQYNSQKSATNNFYAKHPPLSQAFSITDDSVNYARKESHFGQSRHPNEVVQWRVSRNTNSYLQAPEPHVPDTQQTGQKQLQHQVTQPHYIQQPQSPHALTELQRRPSLVGFYTQPAVSRISDVQQYSATMVRMCGTQPTSFAPHLISPRGTVPVQDTRVQVPVPSNKQRNPSSYLQNTHHIVPNSTSNSLPIAVQNKKRIPGLAQYQQQSNRSWQICQNADVISSEHMQHMQPAHHLHPQTRVQQQAHQIQPSQLSPSVQQSLQQSNCRCIVCGAHAMFLCSCCKRVWYCSKPCQDSHWAHHAPECRSFATACDLDRDSVYVTN